MTMKTFPTTSVPVWTTLRSVFWACLALCVLSACTNIFAPLPVLKASQGKGTITISVPHLSAQVAAALRAHSSGAEATAKSLADGRALVVADKVHFELFESATSSTALDSWDDSPATNYSFSALAPVTRSVAVGSGYVLKASVYNFVTSHTDPEVLGTSAPFAVTAGSTTAVAVNCLPRVSTHLTVGEKSLPQGAPTPYQMTQTGVLPGSDLWFDFVPTSADLRVTIASEAGSAPFLFAFVYDGNGVMVPQGQFQVGAGATIPLTVVPNAHTYMAVLDLGTGAASGRQFTITLAVPVATPTISPPPGISTSAQNVSLSSSVAGAEIHYTVDGSTPTSASPLYTASVPLTTDGSTLNIRAIATKAGSFDSAEVGGKYSYIAAYRPYTIKTATGSVVGDGGPATNASIRSDMVCADASGNLFIDDGSRIRRVDAISGLITTVVGTGTMGFAGDGGLATAAQINYARGLCVDAAGNLYFSDTLNNRVRKVDVGTGIVTTIAGSDFQGARFAGDGGPAIAAQLYMPTSLFMGSDGVLYVSDYGNHRVRKIALDGTISTYAGNGSDGSSGDDGPATSAALRSPIEIAGDSQNNIYIGGGDTIRKVDASSGIITKYAGTSGAWGYSGDGGPANSALLDSRVLTLDVTGNLYIADRGRIRKVGVDGIISTIAGTGVGGFAGDGGAATSATIDASALCTDAQGNLFFADYSNYRVRKITAGGVISTVAGRGNGDGGPANSAITYATGTCVDSSGNLFILDLQSIRKVSASTGNISTVANLTNLPESYHARANAGGDLFFIVSNSVYKLSASDSSITAVAGSLGPQGFSGDRGLATSAVFGALNGLALDSSGNIYVSDMTNNRIRKIRASDGIVTTIAGTGVQGFSGDGGPATTAQLSWPQGLDVDAAGNVYFADSMNNRVRKVDATGNISTIAGTGNRNDPLNDNGPAVLAGMSVFSVLLDPDGNLFLDDADHRLIREVFAGSGIITTVAGGGAAGSWGENVPATTVELHRNYGATGSFSIDGAGSIYFSDVQVFKLSRQ